ncbi:MAG TPA: DNA-deoxyinosine glycosylase [Wenzhouxiangellaceae bacterium]|nr:DNA-deoxyinosine glycosylase [Wenzhouxiangellaceae bacterium]
MQNENQDNPLLTGLAPVYAESARVLVLGSMPGARSLQARAYYAHPRNAFWPIMAEILGMPPSLPYEQRIERLRKNGVALWDVIGKCRRSGSLDQKVEPDSIEVNDFGWLFQACPDLSLLAFNGRLAEKSFRRYVVQGLPARFGKIDQVCLPSTSPAHAALRFEQKRDAWAGALRPALGPFAHA